MLGRDNKGEYGAVDNELAKLLLAVTTHIFIYDWLKDWFIRNIFSCKPYQSGSSGGEPFA